MGLVTALKALQRAVGYLLIRTGTDAVCDLCILGRYYDTGYGLYKRDHK